MRLGAAMAVGLLLGGLVPSRLPAQEGGELFRFEGIQWSSTPETVHRLLRERGYEPTDESADRTSFRGRHMERRATIRVLVSDVDELVKVSVVFEAGGAKARAFFMGLSRGIAFNHGPPCETFAEGSVRRIWTARSGERSSALQLELKAGHVRLIYIGPDHAEMLACEDDSSG